VAGLPAKTSLPTELFASPIATDGSVSCLERRVTHASQVPSATSEHTAQCTLSR
jgi:hypothetical protein